jgi:hypothetical protein
VWLFGGFKKHLLTSFEKKLETIMKVYRRLIYSLLCLLPAAVYASEVDYLSVSSIGRGAKLKLVSDLLIPANKEVILMPEASRGNANVVSSCRVEMTETSLDTRVLKAGSQIVFSGEALESEQNSWRIHTLKVDQPVAIRAVSCYAQRMDHNFKWHPTTAIIWDLKTAFGGIAELELAEPVEIPATR